MDDLDALLADLQNSVPCSNKPYASQKSVHHHSNHNGTSGYGSLRTKPKVFEEPPHSQHHYPSNEEYRSNNTSIMNDHFYKCHHQDTLLRSQNVSYVNDQSFQSSQASQKKSSHNFSELDSLLLDLSNARYNTNDKRLDDNYLNSENSYINPSKTIHSSCASATIETRPAVDTLLNEMDSNSIYAVPNGVSSDSRSLTPSRQVMITVTETRTEKSGSLPDSDRYYPKPEPFDSTNIYASSATKELDDLMASLSDFKISSSSHHHQTVTDYAKPNKGVSHSHITQTFSGASTIVEDRQTDQLNSMLGNLQADMNRQGVNTVQKGCCNACEKPIVGQVITALGKTWHPEHFTCNHCSQELGTRNFFERDGYAYCEQDYHNLFSPRCAYCNGAILDKCVTALDKTWHTEHFFCAQCGQQFGEDGFHERDGKPYCRNDYFEMFAPKCNGCNRAIMENYISALNSQWHPDCFVCRDCRQPFKGGSFFDHDGIPYCEMHYHAKRGSLCAGCSKPITGRCITAMFKKFHPEHFVCAFCLKQLNKGTFKEQNDKPYCHTCFDKIFG